MNPTSTNSTITTAWRAFLVFVWVTVLVHPLAGEKARAFGAVTIIIAFFVVFPRFRSWSRLVLAFVLLSAALARCLSAAGAPPAFLFLAWAAAGAAVALHADTRRRFWPRQAGAAPGRPTGAMPAPGPAAPPAPAPQPAASARSAPAPKPGEPPAPPRVHYDFGENMSTPRYRFADVVGMSETKTRLLNAANDIIVGRGNNRNGILMWGDPGNGKTMFAEALAGELKVKLFSISIADIGSMWVGEAEQKVKAAFAAAKNMGFGVFFIDEFDSVLKDRSASGPNNPLKRDLTNTLLTEIVGLRGTKIVLIAATNHLDDLDGAGIREKRFDFKVEVPAPDFEARQAILRKSIGEAMGYEFADAQAIAVLAQRWEGFSAARLAAVGDAVGDLRRDGEFAGKVTFEVGIRALRLLQGRTGSLPESVKSIDEILMPQASRNTLKDLAFKMENVYNLEKIGGRLPTGVAFIGPPGTGKTQAAMSLAKRSGWAFLKITGAEIMARPEAWDKLYRTACDIRPAIVFIDEADGILRDRLYSNYGMLTEKILTTMEGAGGRVRDIIFVAATNHFDRIDSAAVRGGRLEEKIVFDVPDQQDMDDHIHSALGKLEGTWEVPASVHRLLCARLVGQSIANADAVIQKSVDAAAVRRLREQTTDIREADVELAVRSVLIGTD